MEQNGAIGLERISGAAARYGLLLRGAFHPRPEDTVPDMASGRPVATLVLLGFAGRIGWPEFATSPEASDAIPHPLDRWSRRVVRAAADELGGEALFPFGGPPWHPFGRWAVRSGTVSPSPLGILIDRHWGLWHSYRGALAFSERFDLPDASSPATGPCATCQGRPCLDACPVSAFSGESYDVASCRKHLASRLGATCTLAGCLARRACPVGAEHAYGVEQTAFLMQAFAQA